MTSQEFATAMAASFTPSGTLIVDWKVVGSTAVFSVETPGVKGSKSQVAIPLSDTAAINAAIASMQAHATIISNQSWGRKAKARHQHK